VTPAIATKSLEVRYGDAVALLGVDLAVPTGSSLAVIGPNGSGKSTLLGALAGTIEPSGGSLSVAGSSAAIVLQATDVEKGLPITVRETVSLARYPTVGLFRRFRDTDRDAVDRAMARMQVDDLAGRQLQDLSGGQRQRVLVAQGLAQEADVLLLDEPVNGLDLASRAVILDVIDEEVAAGRTVAMTTHSLDDARRCDLVLLLNTIPVTVGPPELALTEDHLRATFGVQFVRVGDGLMLDDAHHHSH
jgi:manganese transport system ATP-binding protein